MEQFTLASMAEKERKFAELARIPIRYHVGDRVRVFSCAGAHVKSGWLGTVLEESLAPWIAFDKRTGTGDPGNPFGLSGWRPDHMGCLTQDQLRPFA